MPRIATAIIALIGSVFIATTAYAAIILSSAGAISVQGRLNSGDFYRFYHEQKRTHPHVVILDSEGGSLEDGLLIAQSVRRIGVSTAIPAGAQCLSACSVIFLAGKQRFMSEDAKLGLHNAWSILGQSAEGTEMMDRFLIDNALAPLDVIYAQGMTGPGSMWYLPRERWDEMNIKPWPQ